MFDTRDNFLYTGFRGKSTLGAEGKLVKRNVATRFFDAPQKFIHCLYTSCLRGNRAEYNDLSLGTKRKGANVPARCMHHSDLADHLWTVRRRLLTLPTAQYVD